MGKVLQSCFGILGGIGPQATAYFYSQVMQRLQASGFIEQNEDFPHIIINSIPAPALVHSQESFDKIRPYIQGVRLLAELKPHFIVMACNTIHLYLEEIQAKTGYQNILSIRDVVGRALKEYEGQKICVLGTSLTVQSGLYSFSGIEEVRLTEEDLERLGRLVEDFNVTGRVDWARAELLQMIASKQADGAEVFLLACTEVSQILKTVGVSKLSTLDLLIEEVVRLCLERK